MKRILIALVTILAVGTVATSATRALFVDTETSTGNTFAAGSLDLTVGANNGQNTIKYTITNMKPLDGPFTASYTLKNVGTIPGYLDLESIAFTSDENGCLEPEIEAGDGTCGAPGNGEGEMKDVITLTMWLDKSCNGLSDQSDDTMIIGTSSYVKNVLSSYPNIHTIPAGSQVCILSEFRWGALPDSTDMKAMGDDLTFDMTFELGQSSTQ